MFLDLGVRQAAPFLCLAQDKRNSMLGTHVRSSTSSPCSARNVRCRTFEQWGVSPGTERRSAEGNSRSATIVTELETSAFLLYEEEYLIVPQEKEGLPDTGDRLGTVAVCFAF